MRLKPLVLWSSLAVLLPGTSVPADLAFTLTPAVQSGLGSNEVIFAGVLTNTSLTDNLFLNNIQVSFTGIATNYLAADTNVFFANVPGILLPGETYGDVVFGIAINPATPLGQYFGIVTLQGGTNIFAATNLAGPTFEVTLSPAALTLALAGANQLVSWPSPPGDFVLQQNSDLATTNWTTVTNVPALVNGQNQVTLPPGSSNQFFRLVYP
ncbi:MAG TPA: hypothetical protein VKU37_05880 [Verrucomicrobiae bacterium]|nr:hypothetical protein [Verrucomicrobiae bacterium]